MILVAVFVLLAALAIAGFFLGGRLFGEARDGPAPGEAPPSGGCCGFNLPPDRRDVAERSCESSALGEPTAENTVKE